MAGKSLRFLLTNLIESATLKNGTGGGAPALDEVAPFLMVNAKDRDRGVLWQQSSGGNMFVHWDLGADRTVRTVAVHGHRPIGGALAGITSYTVRYAAAAAGYPPGAWSAAPGGSGIATLSGRDKGKVLDSDITARYLEYELAVGSVFTLGKFWAGVVDYDLGFIQSRGAGVIDVTPRVDDQTIGHEQFVTYVGDDYSLFSIPYRQVPDSVVAKLLALKRARKTFIQIDQDDAFKECRPSAEFVQSVGFIGPTVTISDATFEYRQLG